MSSTNRAGVRVDKDNYPSPFWTLDALFMRYPGIVRDKVVFDPNAGDGRILLYAMAYGAKRAVGYEIREDAVQECQAQGLEVYHTDALQSGLPDGVDSLVTNPAFSIAQPMIQRYVPLMRGNLSYWLLPLSFIASEDRAVWNECNMPLGQDFLPSRPSFIAVCQGRSETRKRPTSLPRCGRKYVKGTRGECVCGGRIADGVDSNDYAFFAYDRPGRTEMTYGRLLQTRHLDRSA